MRNSTEKLVKDIRHCTHKKYSSEEKIRIVLEGMRGEESIAELCRREGLNQNVYYRWSKEFLETGKQRLAGDIKREASSTDVTDLKKENDQLKRLVADIMLKNEVLKKSVLGLESKATAPAHAPYLHPCRQPGKTNELVSGREAGSDPVGGRFGITC